MLTEISQTHKGKDWVILLCGVPETGKFMEPENGIEVPTSWGEGRAGEQG